MKIKKVSYTVVRKPLKTTFATSLGRKNFITSVYVKTTLTDGTTGVGEIPTSFAVKHENLSVILKTLNEIKNKLCFTDIENYTEIVSSLRDKYFSSPMTLSGVETSLFRAYISYKSVKEFDFWNEFFSTNENFKNKIKKPIVIETDITIPFNTNKIKIDRWLTTAVKNKFKIFKLKISGNFNKDKDLITYVYSFLQKLFDNDNFTLRIDANQGYDKNSYLELLQFLNKQNYKIQLIEQPLKKDDYKGLKYIRKFSHIPIILDETVFTEKDLELVISENLANGVNIKIAKCGLFSAANMVLTAKKHKLLTMIGCMTETMIGLSSAINLVAASKQYFDYIDLDSIFFLRYKNNYENIKICPPNFIVG